MRSASRETALVRQAKSGDGSAFGMLVKKYQEEILYLAYGFVRDYEQARDVAQEIFLKAHSGIRTFEERAAFATWLKRIAVNTCIDFERKRERMPAHEPINPEHLASDADFHLREDHEMLEIAFRQLSENQYTAMVLRYFQDEPVSEIAKIMGIQENTVRIHLHRALLKLRRQIKD